MYNMRIIIIVSSLIDFALMQNLGRPKALSEKNQRTGVEEEDIAQPIFAPDICPKNQFLYPELNGTEWMCDCGPGHIYYPPKDDCYLPYRQGPCNKGQYLIIKKRRGSSECVKNSCLDGSVRYQGKCYELDTEDGPCPPVSKGGGAFGVNLTTMEVGCLSGTYQRISKVDNMFAVPDATTFVFRGHTKDN